MTEGNLTQTTQMTQIVQITQITRMNNQFSFNKKNIRSNLFKL